MGKQGGELKWWAHPSSSTVLLDPAAFVESWKQQIQGKDGIPAEHQRLIFACRVADREVLSYTCKRNIRCPRAEEHATSEFLKELRSWEAILKDDKHTIARLVHPLVAAEEQVAAEDEKIASLPCQTARELRSMGIPCNVYYLFFNKWIPSSLKNGKCCKETSSLNMQIDKDFQARRFEIVLFGRLNGENLPFIYRMNGGEVANKMSMQEQVAQYRQGQQMRHRLGLSTQSVGKGVEGRDVHTEMENDGQINGCYRSEQVDDYYLPCGKDLEFTVITSKDRQLKCFVLTVIQVPANAPPRKLEQLAPLVPGRCEGGKSCSQHEANLLRVSSSGAASHSCGHALCSGQISFSESLPKTSCKLPTKSAGSLTSSEPSEHLASCPSVVIGPRECLQLSSNIKDSVEQVPCSFTNSIVESLPTSDEPKGKLARRKKKRKGKRNGRLREIGNGTPSPSSHYSLAICGEKRYSDAPNCAVDFKHDSELCDTASCSSSLGPEDMGTNILGLPRFEKGFREHSPDDSKSERGPGNAFHFERLRSVNKMEDYCSKMPAIEMNTWERAVTAESSYLEVISDMTLDRKVITLREKCPKMCLGMSGFNIHGNEGLPEGSAIPCLACPNTGCCEFSTEFRDPCALTASPDHTYMSTSACLSQDPMSFQPFVGPILVDVVLQESLPSSDDGEGSPLPFRELVGNLEACNDTKEKFDFSDSNVSARGGHNRSGTGSRNGRSGADGSSNRNGRGSDDRKGTGGYHGSGQGSSGSNHSSGPGGSSTSGGSGGSGGGNGNRGGGRGSSGGGWDGRRVSDDGGSGSKEGDDERHRNGFQVGSNGETPSESLQRKKGISLSEQGHSRKGVIGMVAGDQLMNGSHGSTATTSGNGKENLSTFWQKVQKPSDVDDFADQEGSFPTNHTSSAEGIPRSRLNSKLRSSTALMNGNLVHEGPQTNENTVAETKEGADHHLLGRATQDSFVKVLKQSITDSAQASHHVPSASSGFNKDSQSLGGVPAQDFLKGAWQKKISWDEQPQPAYSKHVPEAAPHVGPSKGKLSVKPVRNGIQIRNQSFDTETATHPKSLSAPSTPSGFLADASGSREFGYIPPSKPPEGCMHQSTFSVTGFAGEQVPHARLQQSAANTSVAKNLGEARSAFEETSQKLTTWKSRKPIGEQDRAVARDRNVCDREQTVHWAQKWVPVDRKNGGLMKGPSIQSKSWSNAPPGSSADSNGIEMKENQHDLDSKKIRSIDGDSPGDEVLCSSSLLKSLRRLQTFPSGSNLAVSRIADSGAEVLELKEPSAVMATQRPCGLVEQANLRSLLPRARTLDNPSRHGPPKSLNSVSIMSVIPGEKENIMDLGDRSGNEITAGVRKVLSPAEQEMQRVARVVLDAVRDSCRDRWAAERIVRLVGCHMAEFEKVLSAVAPLFLPVLDSSLASGLRKLRDWPCNSNGEQVLRSREHPSISQISEEEHHSICRGEMADTPLNSIWKWYEEPSYYGVEVRAVDSQRQKNGEAAEPFLAYYEPYLSGLQLFGYSSEDDFRGLGGSVGTKGNTSSPSSSRSMFSGNDVLATLLPRKVDEWSTRQKPVCNARDYENFGLQLLYEFYEADLPQVRQPLFPKVKELSKGILSVNSHSSGDPAVLDGLRLGDVHPASWFAVAWYPIYRISEGPLRAVFLTYHSFSHFAPSGSLSYQAGRAADIDNHISLPVVGMECYNIQAEPWLSMRGQFTRDASNITDGLTVSSSECLENRINSLQQVAALMAKGIPDDKSASSGDCSSMSTKFKHSDYEFFVKRRR